MLSQFAKLSLIFAQVSVIKAKVHEATGMPPGKQKLQLEVSFLLFLPFFILLIFFIILGC